MEARMLIPEKGGNSISAIAKDNNKEVKEVDTVEDCNTCLRNGWGMLAIVPWHPSQYPTFQANLRVTYIMYRTVS